MNAKKMKMLPRDSARAAARARGLRRRRATRHRRAHPPEVPKNSCASRKCSRARVASTAILLATRRDRARSDGCTISASRVAPTITALPGLTCSTCHQEANQEESGVPGAVHWHLAPLRMGWEGLSDGELCRALLDPFKNGGRTVC